VLVVDDTELNRFILKNMFVRLGALVQEASDGADAVEMVRSRPEGRMY
jgi:CheY-like chemotaxis protein